MEYRRFKYSYIEKLIQEWIIDPTFKRKYKAAEKNRKARENAAQRDK